MEPDGLLKVSSTSSPKENLCLGISSFCRFFTGFNSRVQRNVCCLRKHLARPQQRDNRPSASSQANPGGQTAGTAGETQAAPAHSQVDETIAWLTESVNLTPDQQNKLRPILQGEVSQMSAVNSDSTLTPEQKQQKMVDIRRAAGPQIQSVLTPEQQQKLTQMRQSHRWSEPAAINIDQIEQGWQAESCHFFLRALLPRRSPERV